MSEFLTDEDMAALFTFHSQASDHEADGHTVRKETMRRLAELGVVNSLGFGRYETTSFGAWLVETDFEQSPSLPLRTVAEWNAMSAAQLEQCARRASRCNDTAPVSPIGTVEFDQWYREQYPGFPHDE